LHCEKNQNRSHAEKKRRGITRHTAVRVKLDLIGYRGDEMKYTFTLEYWQDDGWYVGKLREVPGIFSQGATIAELEENIEDAYRLTMEDEPRVNHPPSRTKHVLVEVA
jgi:predicted RNase H-like HicB family nuclease